MEMPYGGEYHVAHSSRTLDAAAPVRHYRCTSPREVPHLMTTLWIVLGVWVVCSVPVALILARLFRRPRPGRPGRIESPGGGSSGGGAYPAGAPDSDPGRVESQQLDDEFAPRRKRGGI